MSKTIAITQVSGTIAGGGTPGAPADVTVGTITYQYVWNPGAQSTGRRPDSLTLFIPYTPPGGWTGKGVHAYVEYPDGSADGGFDLTGTTTSLDGVHSLGGTWNPIDEGQFPDDGSHLVTITGLDVPASNQNVNIRVYLVAYTQYVDKAPARATAGSPSPSGVVTVAPPAQFANGEEYAQLVTNFTASASYGKNGQGQQTLLITCTWSQPSDFNFQGVKIVLVRNGISYTLTGIEPGFTVTSEISQFPVMAENDLIYALSVDVNGNTNTFVPLLTPQQQITLNPPTLGAAGTEYTLDVSGVTATVVYKQSADGVEMYGFKFTWQAPSLTTNPEFGGIAFILRDEAGVLPDILLGYSGPNDTTFQTDYWPLHGNQPTWDAYFCSIDVNNRQNTLVPGTTPRVTGLNPVVQTTGKLDLTRTDPAKYNSTTFGNVSSKFDVQNGGIQTVHIANLAVTDAKIASLTASKITAGTISAVTITALTCNGGAITGTTLVLNSGGTTTSLNNTSDATAGIVALRAKNNSGSTRDIVVSDSGFYIRATDQSTYVVQLIAPSDAGELRVARLGTGNVITINSGGGGGPSIVLTDGTNTAKIDASGFTYNGTLLNVP